MLLVWNLKKFNTFSGQDMAGYVIKVGKIYANPKVFLNNLNFCLQILVKLNETLKMKEMTLSCTFLWILSTNAGLMD